MPMDPTPGLARSDWMVVEADESDGSFLRLDGTIAVVTNIDPEHLEHYGDFERSKDAFVEFVENVPFYGLAVMCVDDPDVQGMLGRIRDRRIVTYGTSALADIRAENIVPRMAEAGSTFRFWGRMANGGHQGHVRADAGRHNVLNALAAVAVGLEFGFSDEVLVNGFGRFSGVKRRFTRVGEVGGSTIVDDYAHHPVEIRAVLSAAREAAQERVIAVVQPHRYTRLQNLMDEFQNAFNDADVVFVAPVYPAGEGPIEGVDANALADGLARARPPHGEDASTDPTDLAPRLRDLAAEGDIDHLHGRGRHHQMGGGPGRRNCARRGQSQVSAAATPAETFAAS